MLKNSSAKSNMPPFWVVAKRFIFSFLFPFFFFFEYSFLFRSWLIWVFALLLEESPLEPSCKFFEKNTASFFLFFLCSPAPKLRQLRWQFFSGEKKTFLREKGLKNSILDFFIQNYSHFILISALCQPFAKNNTG